ncbi:MAG: SDR family NAD(P)-dependent oxidoreductase [Rhodospirillales bacterium]|nr:SDR family NAD(P)-dependent oxidoreductase [Rhodospirillales bacterium]
MDVKGHAAIVTGGASGLGEGTARALAAKGAKVAIFDMNEERGEMVAKDIGGVFCKVDVSSAESAEAAFAKARDAHGPSRIVVNCAGVGTPMRTVGKDGPVDLRKYTQVISINLIGTFNICRLAAADMQGMDEMDSGERGIIVNTASAAAFDGQIGQAAYAASKGGVHSMTLPLAREFARFGIRFNTIAPGLFMTPMMAALPQEAQDSLAASVPFPSRLGDPSEFAGLVVHMAENQMLNGETIRLDGSIRMAPK